MRDRKKFAGTMVLALNAVLYLSGHAAAETSDGKWYVVPLAVANANYFCNMDGDPKDCAEAAKGWSQKLQGPFANSDACQAFIKGQYGSESDYDCGWFSDNP